MSHAAAASVPGLQTAQRAISPFINLSHAHAWPSFRAQVTPDRTYRKSGEWPEKYIRAVGLILISCWPHARMRNMDISLTATLLLRDLSANNRVYL